MDLLNELDAIGEEKRACQSQVDALRARMDELAERDHLIRSPAVVAEALGAAHPPCDVPRLSTGFVVLENGVFCTITCGRLKSGECMYFADAGYETWYQVGASVFPPERVSEFCGDDASRRVFVHLIDVGQRGSWTGRRFDDLERALWRL